MKFNRNDHGTAINHKRFNLGQPRILRLALPIVLATIAVSVACGGSDTTEEVYRVGVMESLTGLGETYGTVANNAKQMAADEINDAGGINGRKLELVVEDSKCNAQDAITAYNKLTDVENVKIVLGPSCSAAMLGVAPLAQKDGNILFSGLAVHPDISNAGDYIFRNAINGEKNGTGLGNLMWDEGIKTVATLSESTDYAEGARLTTAEQFKKRGGLISAEERYPSDTIDFRASLTKLMNSKPEAIFVAAQAEFSGGTAIKQLRELGWEGPIYGEIVAIGWTALEIAGDAATGTKAVVAVLEPNNTKGQEVITKFKERYDYITLAWYVGSTYDDVYITAECLKQTGDDQDADGFKKCLNNITWSGAIGNNYSFDERGDVTDVALSIVEVLPTDQRTADNQGLKVLGPSTVD